MMVKVMAVLLAFSLQAAALAQVDTQDRVISVVGTGIAYGEPDMATFEVGVNIVSENLPEASAEANSRMAGVLAALAEAGIESRDVRTLTYNIWREERFSQDGSEVAPVFRVINTVLVTIRDVTRVSELLSRSLEAGANVVGSVQYTLSEPDALEVQAREEAMARARQRAEQLAGLAGVTLGPVLGIVEAPEFGGPPQPLFRGAVPEAAAMDSGVPVASGQLAVTVTLQVSFAIAADAE